MCVVGLPAFAREHPRQIPDNMYELPDGEFAQCTMLLSEWAGGTTCDAAVHGTAVDTAVHCARLNVYILRGRCLHALRCGCSGR